MHTAFGVGVGIGLAAAVVIGKLVRRFNSKAAQQHHNLTQAQSTCVGLSAMALPKSQVVADRTNFFSSALVLSHARVEPLMIMRGCKEFVYDEEGTEYLDSRNNVPILGHADHRVVHAVTHQMSLVNTNSRYLHPNATQLCNELSAVLPKHLRKFFIVSSGSEAIDLALRLARCHTGHKHVIALTQAYHGNTTAVMEVSENKFREPYLVKQDWVTIVDNPDCVNGKHATAAGYTSELEAVLQGLKGKFAAFIMESIVSVGGGVIPPKGYMSAAFRMVREAGGVCIADETQIGLGRTGNWWAFQADGHPDASPDILVIGKQLGNGFPVSLVVATEEIVRSLERTRIDFFSTFGGSSVSCAAALATVVAIKDDNLVEQARCMGDFMIKLLSLQLARFMPSLVKDIRGRGMYIAIQYSSGAIAQHVYDTMYTKYKILATLDGPLDDVMIFKPPLCWSEASGRRYVAAISDILARRSAEQAQ